MQLSMNPKFPLDDVLLKQVKEPRTVKVPLYADSFWQINQNEFSMQVEGVGRFYACNGIDVEYAPAEDATQAMVELYLNGSVYGAILHQRNILPLHGSSFVWKGRGILLCGESGAGKSSLTAAFCMAGAEFLTDDVTPILFTGDVPEIMPLSDRIKLWNDSLSQLKQETNSLTAITPGFEKYYFPMQSRNLNFSLHQLFIIETADVTGIETEVLTGTKLFTSLRNEVYRWEYLNAMPETESYYLEKLLILSQKVETLKVKRPHAIPIEDMLNFLNKQIKTSKVAL